MFGLNNEKGGIPIDCAAGRRRRRQVSGVEGKTSSSVSDMPRLKCILDMEGAK